MSACGICLELLRLDEDMSAVPCGHIYHLKCLDHLCRVQRPPACPKCRKVFSRKQIIRKLYVERLEGSRESEDMQSNIEALESILGLKENETNKLLRDKEQLETDLIVKEIQRVELEEMLEQQKITIRKLVGHPDICEPQNMQVVEAQHSEQEEIKDWLSRIDDIIMTDGNEVMNLQLNGAENRVGFAKCELLKHRNASTLNPQKMDTAADDYPYFTVSTPSEDSMPECSSGISGNRVCHKNSLSATTTNLSTVNEAVWECGSAEPVQRGIKRTRSALEQVDVENMSPRNVPRKVLKAKRTLCNNDTV